jgi:ATP-dependent Lon protease
MTWIGNFRDSAFKPAGGNLMLTGHLGDVMKESAQAALSMIRARAPSLGIQESFYEHVDLHIHVPEGAIPKDGPSAGVAMYTALVSLLTDRPVRADVAMTGEITLRGLVLPIGGVKEKVLAARLGGIQRVLLPERNSAEVEDLPPEVRDDMQFIYLTSVDDIPPLALVPEYEPAEAISRGAE